MHIRCDPLERDIVRISTDMFLQFRSFEENIDLKIFIHNFLRKFVIYYMYIVLRCENVYKTVGYRPNQFH